MHDSDVNDPIIRLSSISLKYETLSGDISVLNDINLDIHKREFVCVLGTSGCGKTTLVNIIAGFIKPSTGIVEQNGIPIDGASSERGVIFQEGNLFPWLNVRGNIAFGLKMRGVEREEREARVEKALEEVGLYEYKEKYIYELSGGMRQRVGLARVLVNDPQIILMDEPFGALDAITRGTMQRLIRKVWKEDGKTILFITHDVDEAIALGTRIIILNGTPSTITEDVKCGYTYDFLEDATEKGRYTEEYYRKKQSLINKMGRNLC